MKKVIMAVILSSAFFNAFSQVELISCNEIEDPATMLKHAALQQWKEPPAALEVTDDYINMNRIASAIFFKNMTELMVRKRRDYEIYLKSDKTKQRDRMILSDRQTAIEAASAIVCLMRKSGNNDCQIIIK